MTEKLDILESSGIAVDLPDGAIPVHCYVIVEYEHPGSDDSPDLPRVVHTFDVGFSLWARIGLLQFMLQQELNSIGRLLDIDEEDTDEDTDDE